MSDPLQYNISSWDQAVSCQSNYSNQLHIEVSKLMMGSQLTGTLLQVTHDLVGPVFSYVVDGSGGLIASDQPLDYELSTKEILKQLKRFGFLITYNPKQHLPADQLQYLETIQKLGYDKLRLLYVYTIDNHGNKNSEPHIVLFNVAPNPGWLDNSYSSRKSDFLNAIGNGTALDITQMSEVKRYQWDWLDYVANIQDILDDNQSE